MEQKTEASQAVDARAEQVSRLLTIGGMMSNVMFNLAQRDNPDAKQFKELCAKWDAAAHDALDLRAALKAQPAPTEAAQGEDSARLLVAVKAYRDLQRKIRVAGRPPHSDYWHQSLSEAEAAIDAALASAETGGVNP